MNETLRRLPGPMAKVVYPGETGAAPSPWSRLKERAQSIRLQFIVIVLAPTVLAAAYYGLIASPRYVSEAEYIVRGVTSNRTSGLGALLTSFGISRTADDTSAIQTFMQSRDAIEQLNKVVDLRAVFGRPEGDVLARYPRFWQRDTFENLYDTAERYISVVQDPTKGITTLKVQAFLPEDARLLATSLLHIAEGMVNQMNDRAQSDGIRNATEEVALAEKDIGKAQKDLTTFRNQELLIDPNSFSTIVLDSIGKLSLDLAQTSASLKETLRMSASSPNVSTLQARADTLDKRITAEREKLAGNQSAIADKMASYEHMTLMRDMAGRRYASALSTLDSARQEARRQQIYIEEMVRPNLPDDSTEPHRMQSILTVFVLAFAAFAMIWILTVGAKDHAQ